MITSKEIDIFLTCINSVSPPKEGTRVLPLSWPIFFISEEELAKEKEKLYEAIGYREDGQVPVYPKEVLCVSSQ